jgi:hypothetical protein
MEGWIAVYRKGWTAGSLKRLDSCVAGRAGQLCTWKNWIAVYLEGLDSCVLGKAG